MNDQGKGVVIERVFNAPVDRVWKYWTKPEMAKKWWGPEGFTAPSIKINLRVGGKYVFAMHGPKGSEWDKDIYSAGVYKEIVPNKKLKVTDYFSDEKGNQLDPAAYGEDPDFPKETTVTVLFKEFGKCKTKLTIRYPKPKTERQLQAMLKSGMKEGWNSSLNKLEANLNNGSNKGNYLRSRLNPYLSFKDNAREAMEFYQTVFGGRLELHTFKEFNASRDPSEENKIMHSMLEAANGITFMAADTPNSMEYRPGTNMSMSLSGFDEKELTGYFEKLSAGGTIRVPLAKAPWGDTFGMFTDKFGIEWLVNIGDESRNS
jgi:PhnB protein